MSKEMKNILITIITLVINVLAPILMIDMYKDYTAKSFVIGTPDKVVKVENLDVSNYIFQENLSTMNFVEAENDNEYIFNYYFSAKDFNSTENNYLIYINDYMLSITDIEARSISGHHTRYFRDSNGSICNEVDIEVTFEFYSTYSYLLVKLTTTDITYFNGFRENPGLVLTLSKVDYGMLGNLDNYINGEGYIGTPLSSDWLAYDVSSDSYYVTQGTKPLASNVLIPATYDDGIHGKKNVTYIADKTFYGNMTIKTMAFEEDSQLNSIGKHAFDGAMNLASIEIPSSMISIGDYAFSSCGLTSVDIPSSVTHIGKYAFDYCSYLSRVNLSTNLSSIDDYAFANCSRLTGITIPSNVTKIGKYAFHNSGLTNATFESLDTWMYTYSSDYTSGEEVSKTGLSSSSIASKYLTYTFTDYYWYKV